MAIRFKMVPKKNIMVIPPKVNYYPCAVSNGIEDLDSLSKKISSRSSMSQADCYGVVAALAQVINESLQEGKIVNLDFLGSFKITLQGTPAATEEELGKANIKGAKIIYHPSRKMKETLTSLEYKRIRD
jgi:predicted histone-like DNA-binding protein